MLAIIIPLFMYLFKPFDINYEEHRFSFAVIALIFGVVDSIVFFLSIILIQKLLPKFVEESKWTVLKELGLWAVILCSIGIANFFLRELVYVNPQNLSLDYLLEEITHSYLFGFLVASLLTLVNLVYLVLSTSHKASDWDTVVHEINTSIRQPKSQSVTIEAESEQDIISFDIADFIFARVDGNYVEFYLKDEQKNINRYIKRNTLKRIEKQLRPFKNVIRVHRSFLINIDYITSVQGNAQGYRLTIDGLEEVIPVSRSYIHSFDAVLSS
ncbi:hypothetical protein CWD77_09195 [Rhodohalobacter barkolensis]|uniref:HTH LytTR-type domain-containing protein n=2 Tax=Rhodohalobacter barkolensis TaxID=2053187 RepID=A0A2N0VHT1_9BACT|nr:hypothetical protein CWD77_09195 [Rhodohalobacter barkolensis]